jgi:hypothetical protein
MRFYAYPPKTIEHPFILRNINQKQIHTNFQHEIIDIGIYDLLNGDNRHSTEKLGEWEGYDGDGWLVVPDCPDIGREFNIATDIDSVAYSKDLLIEYFDPDNPQHLPVIQGKMYDSQSFTDYIAFFKREFPDYDEKVAIGTICRANNKEVVEWTCREVRKAFPNAWIHGFGVRLNHIDTIQHVINSFDSSSWTYPRGRGKKSARWNDRDVYFNEYLARMQYYLSRTSKKLLN